MRRCFLALAFLLTAPAGLWAANLDISAEYRMRALSYQNLNLDSNDSKDHSFMSDDARLGIAVRHVFLETRGEEETSMDVGLRLHALGVAGSTVALQPPLDRAAAIYPSVNFTPFIENAYLRVHQLYGKPIEATFGRQSFRLGSGLLLDDDGAGLTGVTAKMELPWWSMKLQGFLFSDKNPQTQAPNALNLFGGSLDLPTEGTWQLIELIERDRANQLIYGCSFVDSAGATNPCQVSKALRSFTSLRYQISYGPIVFDGEAALEKGAATPTGANPAPNHITFNAHAEVVRAKWKQSLLQLGEGIARASFAHGSGNNPGTSTTDEAFFPSRGHRFDALERGGFGEFFAATPYDAFGGNYSSTTISGLKPGVSGISVAGLGFTPPAYQGIDLSVDFFLYQADRVPSGSKTLGTEWDVRLRYPIQDIFSLSASYAYFTAGPASSPTEEVARRITFKVSGRF